MTDRPVFGETIDPGETDKHKVRQAQWRRATAKYERRKRAEKKLIKTPLWGEAEDQTR